MGSRCKPHQCPALLYSMQPTEHTLYRWLCFGNLPWTQAQGSSCDRAPKCVHALHIPVKPGAVTAPLGWGQGTKMVHVPGTQASYVSTFPNTTSLYLKQEFHPGRCCRAHSGRWHQSVLPKQAHRNLHCCWPAQLAEREQRQHCASWMAFLGVSAVPNHLLSNSEPQRYVHQSFVCHFLHNFQLNFTNVRVSNGL